MLPHPMSTILFLSLGAIAVPKPNDEALMMFGKALMPAEAMEAFFRKSLLSLFIIFNTLSKCGV